MNLGLCRIKEEVSSCKRVQIKACTPNLALQTKRLREQEQSSTQLSDVETHGLLLVQGNGIFLFFSVATFMLIETRYVSQELCLLNETCVVAR